MHAGVANKCMLLVTQCINVVDHELTLEVLFNRQDVQSRKVLLEEFLWQPETPEEEALARQFIPCPFLRELGACDQVKCRALMSCLVSSCRPWLYPKLLHSFVMSSYEVHEVSMLTWL